MEEQLKLDIVTASQPPVEPMPPTPGMTPEQEAEVDALVDQGFNYLQASQRAGVVAVGAVDSDPSPVSAAEPAHQPKAPRPIANRPLSAKAVRQNDVANAAVIHKPQI